MLKLHVSYDTRIVLSKKNNKFVNLWNSALITVYGDFSVKNMICGLISQFNNFTFKAKIKDFVSDLQDYQRKYSNSKTLIYENPDSRFITKTFSELIIEPFSITECSELCSNWGFYTGGAFLLGFRELDRCYVDDFFDSTKFKSEELYIYELTKNLNNYCFIRQGADEGIEFVVNFDNIDFIQKEITSQLIGESKS